ncbi:MAG: type II secretion system F family protein [Candidatus Moranbacteria bacterium]|nr:type II secretion system F family protein [Candidatus Moranbacteria bacterium]
MPNYFYTAKRIQTGETTSGQMVAKDERLAAQQLRSEGVLVTSIKSIEEEGQKVDVAFMDRFRSVPLKEKLIFARNLSVMISSGLPVSQSLNNLAIQVGNKTLKKILKEMHQDVQKGASLSTSLAKYPSVFNDLFVNMVRVGEEGGSLEEALQIIAVQLEKEHELLSKVRGALIYPAVIVVAMVGVGIVMLTYVLPQITGVFEDMEVTLPKSTQFVIALSDFTKRHSMLIVAGAVIFGFVIKMTWKFASMKQVRSFLALKLPIVGPIVRKVNCARFARIYSSLIRSGVPVVDTLKIISRTLTNHYYKQAIEKTAQEIQKGVEMSKMVYQYPDIFPVLVPQMMEVGEQTGKTEAVLQKLAEFYEEEVAQITKNLSSIIEPVLMLLIGTAVGFFAVSMLQPMYSVLENIQ